MSDTPSTPASVRACTLLSLPWLVVLVPLLLVLGAPSALQAQAEQAEGPVSPDSADVLRAAMDRPRDDHPIRLGTVVSFPLRVAFYPLELTVEGLMFLGGVVAQDDLQLVRRVRRTLLDVGVEPKVDPELGHRAGFGAGVEYVALAPLHLEVAGSVREYQRHEVALEWDTDRWSWSLSGQFRRNASDRFFGIGPDNIEGSEGDFRWDRVSADAAVEFRPTEALTLRVDGGVEENSIAPGLNDQTPSLQEVFDEDTIFGADPLTRFGRGSLSAELDLVDRDTLRLSGARVGVRASRYEGIRNTPSAFTRVSAWAHGYIPVERRHVLALRARSELTRDSDAGAPFFYLSEMGGTRGPRSFDWGRFRDRDLLLLSAEWRYEVWRELRERGRAEGFLFWDEGGVARSLDDLSTTQSSYGVGLNVFWMGRTVAQTYLAFGEDETRFSVTFSPYF